MKLRLFIYLLLLCLPFATLGQYTVTPATSIAEANSLIQSVLLGNGITVSNVNYTGATCAVGTYTNNGNVPNFGFTKTKGLIMSTGCVASSFGNCAAGNVSTDNGLAGDATLNALGQGTTQDATVYSFNFTSVVNVVAFRYLFASEEYPEYVNANFNDVFGFFVSGPNPAGGNYSNFNIARIPIGGNPPISIDNVNAGLNSTFFQTNDNCFPLVDFGMDGATKALYTLPLQLVPGATYTIKLAIADVGDGIYDSAVLFEALSFEPCGDFPMTVSQSNNFLGVATTYEFCGENVLFTFDRGGSTNNAVNLPITFGGSATYNADYTTSATTIQMSPGQSQTSITITPILDGVSPEGDETVLLIYTSPGNCQPETLQVTIKDGLAIGLNSVYCITDPPVTVTPIPPDIGVLSGPLVGNTFNPATAGVGTHAITYQRTSGGCPFNLTQTVTVVGLPSVSASASPTSICSGSTSTLTASGATTYTWSPATGLSSTTGATVSASPLTSTTYTVTGGSGGCTSTATVLLTVAPQINMSSSAAPATICSGSTATLSVSGATSYAWSPATGLSATTGTTVIANPTTSTTYTVVGTVGACTASTTIALTVTPLPSVSVSAPQTNICVGGNTSLTAAGATSYTWSPATGLSSTTGATVTASPSVTTTYTVSGTSSGCAKTATITVQVTPNLLVSASASPASICNGSSSTLTASGATTYTWLPVTGLSSTTGTSVIATPSVSTTYTVTGTTGSCTGSATVTVTINSLPANPPNPTANANPGCGSTFLNILTPPGGVTYYWQGPLALGTSTAQTTATTYPITTSGTYYVRALNNTTGCWSPTSGSIVVTINALPNVTVSPVSAQFCSPQSTTLTASGATSYTWSPATGLSATTGATVTATPTITRTYTVTGVTGSCSKTASVTITIGGTIPVTVSSSLSSICTGGSSTLTATGATTYSWTPSTGLSATTGTTVTASPSTTTTYTVTGITGSCSQTATVTVSVVGSLVVSGTATPASICLGNSSTLTASGGSTYLWSPATGLSSTTGASVTASPSTTTTYTVRGTSGACTGTATVTVTVVIKPTVTVTGNQIICLGKSTTLTASGATTYTWSPTLGLSSSTGASVTALPSSTTTYTVTGTTNNCSNTATITVQVRPIPTANILGSLVCNGQNGTFTVQSSNPNFLYQVQTPGGVDIGGTVAGNGGTLTLTVVSTSLFIGTNTLVIKVIDTQTNCFILVNENIYVIKQADLILSSQIISCSPANYILSVLGANSYVWAPATGLSATTGATVTATPATTTTYTVTGTDNNNCTGTATFTVTVSSGPLVTLSSPNPASVCAGGYVNFNVDVTNNQVSCPTTYVSNASGSIPDNNCAGLVRTITIAGNNCVYTGGEISVNLNWASPHPFMSDLIISLQAPNGQVLALVNRNNGGGDLANAVFKDGGSWPTSGTNISGQTLPAFGGSSTSCFTFTGLANFSGFTLPGGSINGNWTLRIYDLAGGDVGTISNWSLTVPARTFNTSNSYSYTLTNGTNVFTYNNVSDPFVATVMPTVTGNWQVTNVTDNLGCTSAGPFGNQTVTVTSVAVTATSSPASVCSGGSSTLTASGATTYAWSPATGLSATTGASVTSTPAVTTTYTVTGTTAGCTGTATVTVMVNPNPSVTASAAPASVCSGSSSTLTASGATTYAWNPGGLSGSSVSVSPASTTTYTVTGTDPSGCTGTATVTVTLVSNPTVSASTSPATVCAGGSSTLTASGATTYAWSPATGLSATTGASVVSTPAATITYTVTGTTAGCTGTATVTVMVNPNPTVSASASPASICAGGSSTLTASGATTYAWSPATGLSATTGASVVSTPAATITYTVTGTTAGCTGTATVTVMVNPNPTVSASASPASICAGGSSTLTASGASTYAWQPGGLSGASVSVSPAVTTTYTVTGTDANGCTGTATRTVTVNPNLVVTATASPATICAGSSSTLTASGATTYSWQPGGLTGSAVTVTPAATTIYTVTGTSAGCTGSATRTVTVNPLPNLTLTVNGSTVCLGQTGTVSVINSQAGVTYQLLQGGVPIGSMVAGTGASITLTVPSANLVMGVNTFDVQAVFGATGCSGLLINPAIVSVNSVPNTTLTLTGSTVCLNQNGTITIANTQNGVTYQVQTLGGANIGSAVNGTGANISITVSSASLPAGSNTFQVLATSTVSSCAALVSSTVDVVVNPLPTAVATGNTVCQGLNGTITVAASDPNFSYQVQTTGGTNLGVASVGNGGGLGLTVAAANLVVGSNNFNIQTTNVTTGCLAVSGPFAITVQPVPTLSLTLTGSTICLGQTGTITVVFSEVGATYQAFSGATAVSNLVAGTGGSITLTVPSANLVVGVNTFDVQAGVGATGCSGLLLNQANVNVNSVPNTTLTLTGSTVCLNQNGTITVLNSEVGATYQLLQGGVLIGATAAGTGGNLTFVVPAGNLVAGANTFDVSATFAASPCASNVVSSVTVIVIPPPSLIATATAPVINLGETTTLNVSGAASYVWNPGGLTGASVDVTPATTTLYTVTGTSANGCEATAGVLVTVDTVTCMNLTLSSTQTAACPANTFVLTATGAATYTWSPAVGLSSVTGSSVFASPTVPTTYTVTGTLNGCVETATVTVNP